MGHGHRIVAVLTKVEERGITMDEEPDTDSDPDSDRVGTERQHAGQNRLRSESESESESEGCSMGYGLRRGDADESRRASDYEARGNG